MRKNEERENEDREKEKREKEKKEEEKKMNMLDWPNFENIKFSHEIRSHIFIKLANKCMNHPNQRSTSFCQQKCSLK